ncbi:pre-mRNA-splicing factor CWC21 [Pyrenophora tritici-repentis]|uniref:Transformer domain containing protein n=1 Tax=Pyrenophora tritici-repentis TaxID=45151 RepID=A0A2W1D0H7_9PLEO|nr:Transformer domain-containing protein [Pyrenophora tritici-repentis]KAF7448356.1 Transformer domain containing protein [Pyrenophora tritici-repentis]KAF7572071.1 Transformer domain containing protein [Pyrenophora tritici-repentis]KAI0582389.1 Transformer domain-containing protein [Pyrenophora tritici-repentis]KAI0588211.1 Transformer domain-containing protein [Pyrenophora tritici-repentis]
MSDNVGLSTPRGSGTSGYVQKNKSLLRPRDKVQPYPKDWDQAKHRPRQPDAEILEHEAKRDIEVKGLRRKLDQERKDGKDLGPNAKRLKSHQVHDLAKAKLEESERLRKALGIRADYEEAEMPDLSRPDIARQADERPRAGLTGKFLTSDAKSLQTGVTRWHNLAFEAVRRFSYLHEQQALQVPPCHKCGHRIAGNSWETPYA